MSIYILAIESSCDETSAAVLCEGKILSNIVSSQLAHERYGGVVPELASRLHQQEIVRVVMTALKEAGVEKKQLSAVAVTQGPGLLGALLVGVSFAKTFAWGLGIPLISIDHMQAHILANFLSPTPPEFPFLCLTVSGGHTQLTLVRDYLDMEIIGKTKDDAAGEAFDKGAKMLGLPYPGGPMIDKLAKSGDPAFHLFPKSDVGGYDFSFSGIKTSLLYTIRDGMKADAEYLTKNLSDLCASYQRRIIDSLLDKTRAAAKAYQVKHIAVAGGVSANSELRKRFLELAQKHKWTAHIPDFEYCTDNAGMIAIAAYYKYLAGQFADLYLSPVTRAE